MKELTSDQLMTEIKLGVCTYYDDLLKTKYPYTNLVKLILGIDSGVDDLKTDLTTWDENKNELITMIEATDLESICEAYSKEGSDDEMIAKFESSISFSTEDQKYAFLSAINAIG